MKQLAVRAAISAQQVWTALEASARVAVRTEPRLEPLIQRHVLSRAGFADALSHLLALKLGDAVLDPSLILESAAEVLADAACLDAVARDLWSVHARNVASPSLVAPFLFFKGNAALLAYRVAHSLWQQGQRTLATALTAQASDKLGVDIHPAALLGSGILLDHGTGIVIGETAVVEDDAALWQGVCLGSTFTHGGDRHPKVRRGAVIGAGAIVLGNIEIGEQAVVAANSVVLRSVPPQTTVAGVPAKIVHRATHVALVSPDQELGS